MAIQRTKYNKAWLIGAILIECILILPVYTAYALSIQNTQLREFTATTTTVSWTTDKGSNTTAQWGEASINEHNRSIQETLTTHRVVMETQSNKTYMYILKSCTPDHDCQTTTPTLFRAGIDMSSIFINISVPNVINTNRIDLRVTTKPFSTVKVFLDGTLARLATPPDTSTGEVIFKGLIFPKEKNAMRLESIDSTGQKAELTVDITVDATPPQLEIKKFPEVLQQPSLLLQGKVSKPSKILIFVVQQLDNTPPERVSGVKLKTLAPNQATIFWDPSPDKDLGEYGVIRDNKLIATTKSPEFTDLSPSGSRSYNYRVQAVDTSCNTGDMSASIDVAIPTGRVDMPQPALVKYACDSPLFILESSGEFTQQIPLLFGPTKIRVVAIDLAGNTAEYTNTTLFDNVPPQFVNTNLDALSPSYSPTVTIRGKVSEKSTVFVTINNEQTPSAFVATDDDGTFAVKAKLRRDKRVGETEAGKSPTQRTGIREGENEGHLNTITLKAIDIAQNFAETKATQVILAQCGFGTGFSVDIGKPKPDMLNPRLILKNFGTVGFNIELKYLDQPETLDFLDQPNLLLRPVSLEEQPKFDLDLERSIRCSQDNTKCYVQLKVRPPPGIDDKKTNLEKEQYISDHRKEDCLIPEVGCYKIPLELEIRYQKKQPIGDLERQREVFGRLGPRIEPSVQRVCIPVEIAIDKRISTKLLPNSFLKSSVEIFDSGIKAIDDILKPLQTVFNIVFYACYLGFAVGFFLDFSQRKSCEGAVIAGLFTEGSFNPEVAENGLCTTYYPEADPKQTISRQHCLRCQESIHHKKEVAQSMHTLCDRIFCPSAPSLQKWIADMQRKGVKHRTAPAGSGTAKEFYIGSDCAGLTLKPNLFQGSAGTNELGIDDIYQLYRLHKNDKPSDDKGTTIEAISASIPEISRITAPAPRQEPLAPGQAPLSEVKGKSKINCANQHPSAPECCGSEYQREWGPVCSVLIPDFEITESRCLSAQQTGAGAVESCQGFRRALNAIGGFCTKSGDIAQNLVATRISYGRLAEDERQDPLADIEQQKNKQRQELEKEKGFLITESRTIFSSEEERIESQAATNQALLSLYGGRSIEQDVTRGRIPDYVKDRRTYLMIIPEDGGAFTVQRGYVVEKAVLADINSLDPTKKKTSLTETLDFIPDLDVTSFFQTPKEGGPLLYSTIETRWVSALCSREFAGAPGETLAQGTIPPKGKGKSAMVGCTNKASQDAWEEVRHKVGVGSKDYIVNPAEDLSSSIKCACLPGITTHLKKWKGILTAVRNCFNAILVTGDGTPGACEAVLSRYVCDFIYTLIKCFVQRYTSGYDRPSESGSLLGIGSLGKMLVRSGTSITEDLQKRYGNSPTYKAAFSEQKMVNSICLFAFTGTFNLRPEALAETDIGAIPVDSQPFLFPCERRFIQFDVASNPPGLATWNYHVGTDLFAGADLTYALKLKCSSGFDCDVSEGFQNGQCDCSKIGEKTQTVQSGNLKQFENIGERGEIFENVQSRYRFDRALLEYQYRDKDGKAQTGKQECKIETVGGDAPGFCAFDILEDTFRCSTDMFNEFFAKFNADPIVNYPDPLAQVFKLGDDVSFSLPIVQRIPEGSPCSGGRTCPSTKYLVYSIRNGQGTVVATNDPGTFDPSKEGEEATTDVSAFADITDEQVLNTQGERIYTIKLGSLTDELFNRAARKTSGKVTSFETEPSDVQEFITITREAGKTPASIDLFVEVKPKQGTFRSAKRGPEGKPGETVESGVLQTNGDIGLIRTQGYIITISSLSKSSKLTYLFIPPFQQATIEKRCDPSKPSKTTESWHATFEIRDASQQQLGEHGIGTQIAVVNGRAQRKDASFKVLCNPAIPAGKRRNECTEGINPRFACHCYTTTQKIDDANSKDLPGNCGKTPGQACLDGQCTTASTLCPRDEPAKQSCVCGFQAGPEGTTEGTKVKCNTGETCAYNDQGPNACLKTDETTSTSLSIRKTKPVSKEHLISFMTKRLAGRPSDHASLAESFIQHANGKDVDPAFLVGLAVAESNLNKNTRLTGCNNMFNLESRSKPRCPANSRYAQFANLDANIAEVNRIFSEDYLPKGQDSIDSIGGALGACGTTDGNSQFPCCTASAGRPHCFCCDGGPQAFNDWKNNIMSIRNEIYSETTA